MRLDPEFASGGHLIALQEGHGTQDSHPGSTSPNPRDREKGYFTKEIGGNVNDSMMHHSDSSKCIRFFGFFEMQLQVGGHLIALEEGHGTRDSRPGSISSIPRDREKRLFY
jgi:hypothetical protein